MFSYLPEILKDGQCPYGSYLIWSTTHSLNPHLLLHILGSSDNPGTAGHILTSAGSRWEVALAPAGEPEKDAYVIRSPQNEGRALAESRVCTRSVVSTIGVCRNKKSFGEKS